jgi:phenylacetate-CoA ligase
VPLATAEVAAQQAISQATLARAGIGRRDRVLISLRQDGSPAVGLLAEAAAPLAAGVAVTGPQGRLRLLATVGALKPTVWVTTPCGAADFLARLYMEFNVDPVEMEFQRIILVGEVASPGVRKRLAKEFEAEVSEVYCDPVFGAALASRKGKGGWEVHPGVLALAELAGDEIAAEGLAQAGGPARELVVRPTWSSRLSGAVLRTGTVVTDNSGDAGAFTHTVGDHVLLRGRWLSLPVLRRQLALIDGIAGWTLEIERGDRTLDVASLKIVFERETLVANPMWKARIQQAVAASTPVKIDVATSLVEADSPPPRELVVDRRGHHLGADRRQAGG